MLCKYGFSHMVSFLLNSNAKNLKLLGFLLCQHGDLYL